MYTMETEDSHIYTLDDTHIKISKDTYWIEIDVTSEIGTWAPRKKSKNMYYTIKKKLPPENQFSHTWGLNLLDEEDKIQIVFDLHVYSGAEPIESKTIIITRE